MRWGLYMFLTWVERAAVALSIATMLANAEFARAAEQNITPLAVTECQAMARKISQAVGIKLSTKVGGPDFAAGFLPGVRGSVCLMSGRATGLNAHFDKVQDQLHAVLSDWTFDNMHAADSSEETIQWFAKGMQHIAFDLVNGPPRGTCENVPTAACKVPRQRWIWTLKVAAFASSSDLRWD
jgi:hypothetical protein